MVALVAALVLVGCESSANSQRRAGRAEVLQRHAWQIDTCSAGATAKMRLREVAVTAEAIARLMAAVGQAPVKVARAPPQGQLELALDR